MYRNNCWISIEIMYLLLKTSVATRSFGWQNALRIVLLAEKVDFIFRDLTIGHSVSLVPWTYSTFILISISSSWISVVFLRCCDWNKLWLLIILLNGSWEHHVFQIHQKVSHWKWRDNGIIWSHVLVEIYAKSSLLHQQNVTV